MGVSSPPGVEVMSISGCAVEVTSAQEVMRSRRIKRIGK
jgi:hypothetical protein